jgi:hypothetical protein
VGTFHFTNQSLLAALRMFLAAFRLPKEVNDEEGRNGKRALRNAQGQKAEIMILSSV